MELMKIGKIKANPSNPRIIKDEKFKKLVQSIKDFPEMLKLRPIVIDDEDMVLGGNMRLKACLELGLKEVPVIRAKDLTEEQKKEFIIKDNVNFGEWDYDMLANEWGDVGEWGLDVPVEYTLNPLTEPDPFSDPGITDKNQYGVIVMCDGEDSQKKVFEELIERGFNCKIVVT